MDHANLQVLDHPLIRSKLTRMRDRRTSSREFRLLLGEIAGLMTYEISRDFPVARRAVETPLESCEGWELAQPITVAPILRAGVGMTESILNLIPEARVGFIGIYRDESSLEPVDYYAKFPPDVAAGPVLLVDPMLATGGSAVHAVKRLKDHGCGMVRLICLVAAPEGVEQMALAHPDVPVYAAALDRQLNQRGYILPGLGDAGDRLFGTA